MAGGDGKMILIDLGDEGNLFKNIKHYCFYCKKVTNFGWCPNCGGRFCLGHADSEEDGDWESGYHTYLTHHNCGR
mgnify:CR=1 FL=1